MKLLFDLFPVILFFITFKYSGSHPEAAAGLVGTLLGSAAVDVKQAPILLATIVVSGATGTGKTYLACALAHQACRCGYRALYRRASRLYDELQLARADGSYGRLLSRIAKPDVLVLDDWGLAPLKAAERQDLLEILDDRHGTRSTIVVSQLPVDRWHEVIGDPTIADAICDRLVHTAHRISLKGPSRRKKGADAANTP